MRLPSKTKISLLSIAMTSLMISCGRSEKSSLDTEISGQATNVPSGILGQGFRSDTQTIVMGNCVAADMIFAGNVEGNVEYKQDLTFDEVLDTISGGLNMGVKFKIFDIKGAAEYASKESSDDFSSTISIISSADLKRATMNPQTVRLTDLGRSALDANGNVKATVARDCGDEFVSQITYSAKLFINAKFRFQSAQDKEEFKGNASVSLAGLGEIGGNLSKLSDRLKKSTSVSISARQIGGSPEKLGQILHTSVLTCNLADFETKCMPMLENLVNYASKTFPDSLNDVTLDPSKPTGWAQVLFTTAKFSSLPIAGVKENENIFLVHSKSTSLVSREIEIARNEVYDAYETELTGYQRATDMLKDSGLTSAERAGIKAVQTSSGANRKVLSVVGETCLREPENCIAAFDSYKSTAKEWDHRALSLKPCLLASEVENTAWNFSRSNGTQMGVIRLARGGKIEFPVSSADATWKVEGCLLRFYNTFGVQTTVFEDIQSLDAMTGVYYFDGSFRHVIKRLDSESAEVREAEKKWIDQQKPSGLIAALLAAQARQAEEAAKAGK